MCVVRRTPSHCSTTQHDMLPQQLVCKYELNCEYCNITLARNKAPWWWWSDKIDTCRECLKVFYVKLFCIRWLMNWSDSAKMHGATIRFQLSGFCFVTTNVIHDRHPVLADHDRNPSNSQLGIRRDCWDFSFSQRYFWKSILWDVAQHSGRLDQNLQTWH